MVIVKRKPQLKTASTADSLYERARVAFEHSRWRSARACAMKSLVLQRKHGSARKAAVAVALLAEVELQRGKFGAACKHADKLVRYPDIAVPLYEKLGEAALSHEDLDTAEKFWLRSLAIERRVGNPGSVATVQMDLASLAKSRGDLRGARALLKKAIATFTRRQMWDLLTESFSELLDLDPSRNDLAAAAEHFRADITIWEQNRMGFWPAAQYGALAIIERQIGNVEDSVRLAKHSLDLYTRRREPKGIADQLRSLARSEVARGRLKPAAAYCARAMLILRDKQLLPDLADTSHQLAQIEHQRGHISESRRLYNVALSLNQRLERPLSAAKARLALARLDAESGRANSARKRARFALKSFDRIGAPSLSRAAHKYLAALGPPEN